MSRKSLLNILLTPCGLSSPNQTSRVQWYGRWSPQFFPLALQGGMLLKEGQEPETHSAETGTEHKANPSSQAGTQQ